MALIYHAIRGGFRVHAWTDSEHAREKGQRGHLS